MDAGVLLLDLLLQVRAVDDVGIGRARDLGALGVSIRRDGKGSIILRELGVLRGHEDEVVIIILRKKLSAVKLDLGTKVVALDMSAIANEERLETSELAADKLANLRPTMMRGKIRTCTGQQGKP